MNQHNYCLIMAGGIGARFWPMSRQSHPKQFIDILGTGETLIQQTFRRFKKLCPPENIYIVTNETYIDLVMKQLPEITRDQILSEPARRNTAPCIAYGNYRIRQRDENANIIVAPSDHIILKEDEFTRVMETALNVASRGDCLLTVGIQPSRPETGYGYIQFDENQSSREDERARKVKTFTEKPKLEMAEQFLASGDFLWNSGIFIWNLKSISSAFEQHLPDISQLFDAGNDVCNTDAEPRFIQNVYAQCRSISIDYGIMEKANNVYVVAADIGWSDLGTWGSLYEIRSKDDRQNAIVGNNVIMYDSQSCIVNMPKDKLAVLQGLHDFIVVEEDGILLICRKADEQNIRQYVNNVLIDKGEKYI